MEPLDAVKDIRPGFEPRPVFASVVPLPFQQAKEAFHGGIVRTPAHAPHTAEQVVPFQEATVIATGKPAAVIRVQDHRRAVTPDERSALALPAI